MLIIKKRAFILQIFLWIYVNKNKKLSGFFNLIDKFLSFFNLFSCTKITDKITELW